LAITVTLLIWDLAVVAAVMSFPANAPADRYMTVRAAVAIRVFILVSFRDSVSALKTNYPFALEWSLNGPFIWRLDSAQNHAGQAQEKGPGFSGAFELQAGHCRGSCLGRSFGTGAWS
jgi:hypothetical protein